MMKKKGVFRKVFCNVSAQWRGGDIDALHFRPEVREGRRKREREREREYLYI
jgi:hypothetical protein